MKEENIYSTFSTDSSSGVLTAESLLVAIKALKEASKEPFIVDIRSRYEWWKLIKLDNTARNFSLYGGIPCIQDKKVPANIARLTMSDGTYKDIEISNKPKFLTGDNPPEPTNQGVN